jgi:nucleoid DNA-binding protein
MARTLSKAGLISVLGEKTGFKKAELTEVLDALAEVVREELLDLPAGGRVKLPGIATLVKRLAPARGPRMGRNPQTGEPVKIKAKPEHLDVKAKIDKALKEAVLKGKRNRKK